MEAKERIKKIRELLKADCKTLSVRGGTGTAYGWLEVRGSLDCGKFTEAEKQTLEKFSMNYGGNFAVMDYVEQRAFLERNGVQ
jgi:hypothetical protein